LMTSTGNRRRQGMPPRLGSSWYVEEIENFQLQWFELGLEDLDLKQAIPAGRGRSTGRDRLDAPSPQLSGRS